MADLPITQPQPSATPKPMLILVILDESGSMATKKSDVIGGFNTFLSEQQAQPGVCRMVLMKFNTQWSVVHKATPLAGIQPLTAKGYTPGGGTALLDAVAEGVRVADADKQENERVLCLIITDGEENSSRETTKQQLLDIIKEREGRGDWTFTYLGPDPAKFAEQGYVSSVKNAAVYAAHAPGVSFAAASHATTGLRGQAMDRTDAFYEGMSGDKTATTTQEAKPTTKPEDKPVDVR